MGKKTLLMGLGMIFLALEPAQAALYEYTDENGATRVVDNFSKIPETYKDSVRTIESQKVSPPDEAYLARRKASQENVKKSPTSVKKVEIYVKSWCPYCKQALKLLDSKGVRYMSYDVETDAAALARFKAMGGEGVPLLVIGSQLIRGYSAEQILNALASR